MTRIHFDICDSTNTRAREYLKQNSCDSALFTANEQTSGRGRQGKSFFSPKDSGIYMTFVKRVDLALCDTVFATTFAACAVCSALDEFCADTPKIKWVNDIYINDKKVCGILTESVTDFKSGSVNYLIIGVGINLTSAFPDELSDIAGNIGAVDKAALIEKIVLNLNTIGVNPADRSYMDYYRSRSLVIGREIVYTENGTANTATALGIDDEGGLIVQNSQNIQKILRSGEISLRFC